MICIGITIGIGPSGALLHTIGIRIGIGVGQWKCTIRVSQHYNFTEPRYMKISRTSNTIEQRTLLPPANEVAGR